MCISGADILRREKDNMKKKIIALLLCVTMAVSVTACGKNNEEVKNTENDGSTGTAVTSGEIEYHAADYVTLGEYKAMDIELDKDYSTTEEDVENYINNSVIANYPYYEDSDKKTVEEGDFVNLDYTGTMDGEEFSGGSSTDFVLGIGKDVGPQNFIDGFEDGMIGMMVGEEKDLNLTFPEDYSTASLAGKDVVFHVKVNKIVNDAGMTYDTLTDEYVAYLCEKTGMSYENVDAFVTDIRDYLTSSNDSSKESAVRSAVINKLLEICTIDKLPNGLFDARVTEMKEIYKDYYGCETMEDLKTYVEEGGSTTYEEFIAQIESDTESDIKTMMILETIAEKEGKEFVEADFNEYVDNLVSENSLESADTLYLNYAPTVESGKVYLEKIYVCNQVLSDIVEDVNITTAASDTEQ